MENHKGLVIETMKFPLGLFSAFIVFNICVAIQGYTQNNSTFLTTGRIVNGIKARIEDFPFQLSLRRGSQHICGASVLDSTWAITAAHCIEGYDSFPFMFTLRVGTNKRLNGGEILRINKIYQHPNYNHETVDCDVALLRTNFKFLRSVNVLPIKLPALGERIPDNAEAIISGWGHMRSRSNILSAVLRYAKVYIVDQKNCNQRLKLHGQLTDAMFCAAALNTDACQGDSGGPIQINGKLAGLVSWGVGCADPLFPGVYTRLAFPKIRTWIKSTSNL